jgi:hypothetical protein
LAAHLGEGDPDAWRAALRVFELSYGKPAETLEDLPEDIDPFHVAEMTQPERARLIGRVVRAYPQLAELAPASFASRRRRRVGPPRSSRYARRDSKARLQAKAASVAQLHKPRSPGIVRYRMCPT